MKPNSWPHLVQWDGEAWKCAYFDKVYPDDALIEWSEAYEPRDESSAPVIFNSGVKL